MKTVREVPGKSREGPTTIVQSFNEKIFFEQISSFLQKIFSPFQDVPGTVLDTVTTEFDDTGADLINIT